MIKFINKAAENKQFIEITEISNIDNIISLIYNELADMAASMSIDRTEPEILIEITAGFGISLNQFKMKVNNVSSATVKTFTVNFDEADQRYY